MAKKIMHGVFFCVQVKGAVRAVIIRILELNIKKKEYNGKKLKRC